MEFIVNEQGCQVLSQEMYNGLDQISNLISELESMDGTLRNALGDDYESIGKNINEMKSEFENALSLSGSKCIGDRMKALISIILVNKNTLEYIQSLKKLRIKHIIKWKMLRV